MKEVRRMLWAHITSDLEHNVVQPVVMMLAGAVCYLIGYLAVLLIDPSDSLAVSIMWFVCVVFALMSVVWAFFGFVLLVYRCMIKLPNTLS